MEFKNLKKLTARSKKRLGRGYGSGKAKTSGRGQKGQSARYKIPLDFEGGQLPLIKRLPLLRGRGKNKSRRQKNQPINLKSLNILPDNCTVDMDTLVKFKFVDKDDAKDIKIKILGDGELSKKLIIKLPCSKGAQKKIVEKGGKVERNS
jgi:large subunit ribosomal protein L15